MQPLACIVRISDPADSQRSAAPAPRTEEPRLDTVWAVEDVLAHGVQLFKKSLGGSRDPGAVGKILFDKTLD